ncbi:MAG: TatD family hydrolase, partial [Candidatus Yanofskybacteria bacterium]|nr:TatD family hydrolase [Candidatus Yanofskybacteria bacterium]
MFFDSHCHPQFPQYDQDREEMIKRTLDNGVKMIAVGTDFEMSVKAVELAKKYDHVKLPNGSHVVGGIWAAVGLHPNDNLHEEVDIEKYRELLKEKKVVAIGEIGLDYYRTTGEELIAKQKDRFIKFLELARETNKPLILHCRDAYMDMLEMLDAAATLFSGSAVRGVVHSFTSN